MKAIFEHECELCHYLGPFGEDETKPTDLYICIKNDNFGGGYELLQRYSSVDQEYSAINALTLGHIVQDAPKVGGHIAIPDYVYPFTVAVQRAHAAGLLPKGK